MATGKKTKKTTAPVRSKTAKPKRKTSRKGKQGLMAGLRQYLPGWPTWLGAAVVVGSCWMLYKVMSARKGEVSYSPPKGYTVHGIDISHHQGIVDWELLRNQASIDGQPLSFVFMKATEGGDVVDRQFSRNFSAAKKFGIMRGAYHFYRHATPAKQQAANFIRQVTLEAGDLPPVLDVEVKPEGVSTEDFRQGILEWLVRVEQHYGVKPILYTYHSFRQQYMNDSVFNLYPYWIAHYYVDSVRYRGPWAFWQHSDRGEIPGIKGSVDLDIFRGSFDELQALRIGNNRKDNQNN